MVAPDTQKIMDMVEEKTGYSVSVLVDDKITTHASMVSANSSVPMHLVKVNPKYEKYGDYLVALQCAMLLIKWGDPERIPDFVVLNDKAGSLTSKFAKLSKRRGVPPEAALEYANMIVSGILQQLNSLPTQIISMDMITELCPDLRSLQEESVNTELREITAIFTKQIRKTTPKPIFDRSAAMNSAYTIKWTKITGDKTALLPYQSLGYMNRGEQLLGIYEAVSKKNDPDRYIETVDGWAKILKMDTWYEWRFRKGTK